MGHVIDIEVELPHSSLENADWADAYQVSVEQEFGFGSAREAGEAIFQAFPKVTNYLLVLRGIIMAPFGLKGPKHIESINTDSIGFFPVMRESEKSVTAGFDDMHLDFRIVVDLGDHANLQSIKLATIIKRHNWIGWAYLATILPFHRWIIRSALARVKSQRENMK